MINTFKVIYIAERGQERRLGERMRRKREQGRKACIQVGRLMSKY